MKTIVNVIMFLLVFAITSCYAISLKEAKQQKLVKENNNGYIEAVSSKPSPEIKDLVKKVNAGRKKTYEEFAKKYGKKVEDVAKKFGKKYIADQ